MHAQYVISVFQYPILALVHFTAWLTFQKEDK